MAEIQPMYEQGITALYPDVVYCNRNEDGCKGYDADGNEIPHDVARVTAKAIELYNDFCWQVLRENRNARLADSDYAALGDVTMTDDMKTYRQALRDLPANTENPLNPTWPTKPS
jgi:hypothetical protein